MPYETIEEDKKGTVVRKMTQRCKGGGWDKPTRAHPKRMALTFRSAKEKRPENTPSRETTLGNHMKEGGRLSPAERCSRGENNRNADL